MFKYVDFEAHITWGSQQWRLVHGNRDCFRGNKKHYWCQLDGALKTKSVFESQGSPLWGWKDVKTRATLSAGVVLVSAITLCPLVWRKCPLVWRKCEAIAREQTYLFLIEPAVSLWKLSLNKTCGSPHPYVLLFNISTNIYTKISFSGPAAEKSN
jgi:hypothetical protein